jgi:hypothetical protein
VLSQLEGDLPDGFWIESLQSSWRVHEDLRLARGHERPVLHLQGRAREGTESLSALLETYVTKLRKRFPSAEFVYRPSPSGEKFDLDLTLFAPPEAPEPAAGSSEETAKATR